MATIIKRPYRSFNGTEWDKHYFETSAEQVKTANGSDVETELAQIKTQTVPYATTTGTANTYTATLDPAPTSLMEGMAICVKINVANTGASTLNINGLGAKSIKKSNGSDVSSGNLKVGGIYTLRYDGLNFILQGEGGEYGTATPQQVRTGYTIGTENGIVPGTLNFLINVGESVILNGGGISGSYLTYTKKREVKVLASGRVRVKFSIRRDSYSPDTNKIYGRIYVNGNPVGIERSTLSSTNVMYSEDIEVNENDLIQLYVKTTDTSGGYGYWDTTNFCTSEIFQKLL